MVASGVSPATAPGPTLTEVEQALSNDTANIEINPITIGERALIGLLQVSIGANMNVVVARTCQVGAPVDPRAK